MPLKMPLESNLVRQKQWAKTKSWFIDGCRHSYIQHIYIISDDKLTEVVLVMPSVITVQKQSCATNEVRTVRHESDHAR